MDGEAVQHIEYVPFGEVFIEERNDVWNTPYLFNAKELDEETGLYYYGARYYDPRTSVWLSADPLQEMYPNISSYCYTFNNPVKYIDPDGTWVPDADGNLIAEEGVLDLKAGNKVTLDNVYTRSIANSTSEYTLDAARSEKKTNKDKKREDNYNCWGSAIAGSQEQDIKVGVGIPTGDIFDDMLDKQYTSTNASDAKFGITCIKVC